jgi:Icc-related predicted phosphoesterase
VLNTVTQRLRSLRRNPPPRFEGAPIQHQNGQFIIVGDLQRTSRIEFWRKSNAAEQRLLMQQITAEAPDFLAIVGDLVFCGASVIDWASFDKLAAPLHQARVPILPLLGNHDYWLAPRLALTHFFTRFPHLDGRHWFSTTYGPLGLIFLDSNVRRLPVLQWQKQAEWYQRELQHFEQASHVRGVLVLLHHPPYTNSQLVPDDEAVQQTFVPPFLQAGKTLSMVSGHVHSYERYARAGKTFLVTGGGGPRCKLATGHRRRHVDDCFGGPPVRGFHYLSLKPLPDGLEIAMRELQPRHQGFATLDRVTLPWATGAVPGAA